MPSASTSATPYQDSPHGSDWSTASNVARGPDSQRQLARHDSSMPALSLLKQQVLTEDEYTEGVSEIIKRTFFPQLRELDAHNELVSAFQSEDPRAIEASVRKMRELCTPTPRRRNKAATPGRTPFGTEPADTPTHFNETPSSRATPRSRREPAGPGLRYDPTLSLDAFQAAYTSEDNSSFAELLAKDNAERKDKHKWAWEAERRANIKAVRGREARERLVDVTRQMVESDPDGVVRMIEGAPGRPGDRKLVVEGAVAGGAKGRLMVEGKRDGDGRLMITDGSGASALTVGREATGESEVQFVDWDKPTVEEDEAAKEVPDDETQVPMEGHRFTNRNSLMFPPDADGPVPQSLITAPEKDGLPPGAPKGIRYHATRLDHIDKAVPGAPSPSRSRINAAITGTPYHARPSSTPKVGGFSFVDALPTPRASTIDPKDLQELMTWGSIAATPVALRSAASSARSALGEGGGPFRISDTSRREALAHKMANKAKRSLADRDRGHASSTSSKGLRRAVLDSTRGHRDEATPRSPRGGVELSPAAQNLLKKTGQGRALDRGMSTSSGWKVKDDERAAKTRALIRARELESREVLRRTTWETSPGPELAFEPDMPSDAIMQ